MMWKFDPYTNPYADDLSRLAYAPRGRYSIVERNALARITASKLYKLELVEPFYIDRGFSCWRSASDPNIQVEIEVIFQADMDKLDFTDIESNGRPSKILIVLCVGRNGVAELFNGPSDHLNSEEILLAAKNFDASAHDENQDEARSIPARSADDAISTYQGNVERGDDNGNGGDRGRGGNGSGGGGDLPGGASGGGGVRELINHPILFTIDRQIFDSILEQV